MKNLFIVIGVLIISTFCFSQDSTRALFVKKSHSPIKIDGILDEAIWDSLNSVSGFIQHFPYDTSEAITHTKVCITYDDKNIYIGAICFDNINGDYVVQSLKRDFSYPKSDAFAVFIDPLSDENNGFSFAVNPLGVQREGLVADGGMFGVTTSWDNRWFSEVSYSDTAWFVEMAIPFKSIRFKKNSPTWLVNFSRHNLKQNENSSWVGVPRNFNIASLANTGVLKWEEAPKRSGVNIDIIPYAIAKVAKDYEENTNPEFKPNIGLDAKVGITSSLNLDITINPDFSQVEVDRQIINLDRFSLFFPEQRKFFIENGDLFANFGFRQIRPFFSRRIGLDNGYEIPIIGGLRLSGKVSRNLRIGVMTMQTQGMPKEEFGGNSLKSQNYTTIAFQQKVLQKSKWFGRSNVAMIFVNRQAFNGYKWDKDDFNRVVGLDFNIASKDGRLLGKLFSHHSFSPEFNRNATANASWLQYTKQNFFVMWNHEYVNKNYEAEVGFVPRTSIYNSETGEIFKQSYIRFEPKFDYYFYPKSGKINRHGPELYVNLYLNDDFKVTDNLLEFEYELKFQNKSIFAIFFNEKYTYLTVPFDPSGNSDEPLPGDSEYYYRDGGIFYESDFRKKVSFILEGTFGSYFNGSRLSYGGEFKYRFQPWGSLTITAERNEIRLPEPYSDGFLTLVGPKVEVSFTKSLFFSTFIQYNTQIQNLNINTRFQWRFKPMSDLFIVYTDNYDTFGGITVRNRAFVIKLNYWF